MVLLELLWHVHDPLSRFDLEELRQACNDVAATEVTLRQSTCETDNNLREIHRNMDDIGRVVEEINDDDKEEEIVSDDELEELHEFLSTQRQQNSDTRVQQSAAKPEHLPSNEEGGGDSKSEKDDMIDLSKALLRKLEESFADQPVEDDNRTLSGTPKEDGEICEKPNDLPNTDRTHDSDQLMLDAIDSNSMEANDVDGSSAMNLSASEDYEEDTMELDTELDESCVADNTEGDRLESLAVADSTSKNSSEICDASKDSQLSVSADVSDDLALAAATGGKVKLSHMNALSTQLPISADMQNLEMPDDFVAKESLKNCDVLRDSQIAVCADVSDDLALAAATDRKVEVSQTDGLPTQLSTPAEAREDKACSDDTVDEESVSAAAATAVPSGCYSAASPQSLFDESSHELCDLERLNSSKDLSASSADNNGQMLDAEFIDVDELITRCESPKDLFDSPRSHPSTALPAASPQAESEILTQQGSQTLSLIHI